ncbi:MAG: preprotein translocase subunit YajC [Pseudomonadota bacterium]
MSFSLLISDAIAQAAPAAPGGPGAPGGSMLGMLMPFILIFVIFYFLIILPNKKRMKQEQEMLKSLDKGDEIFTKSGILGTIVGMTDKVVTLDLGEGTKIKLLRSEIGGSAKKMFEEKKEEKK